MCERSSDVLNKPPVTDAGKQAIPYFAGDFAHKSCESCGTSKQAIHCTTCYDTATDKTVFFCCQECLNDWEAEQAGVEVVDYPFQQRSGHML